MEEKNLFIMCDCEEHAISIDFDEDFDGEIFLSFWSNCHHGEKPDRKYKRKLIKRIRKFGHPYVDNICLDVKKARDLSYKLTEICDEVEEYNKKEGMIEEK